MKHLTYLLFVAFSLPGWAEQSTIEVDSFNAVTYTVPYSVTFVPADEPYVRLDGDEDLFDRLEIEVDGSELSIRRDEPVLKLWRFNADNGDLSITIGYPELERIRLSGSGDGFAEQIENEHFTIDVDGSANMAVAELISDSIDLDVAGSGGVTLDEVDAEVIISRISGSGDISVQGTTVVQEITVTGSGDYSADQLRAVDTRADVIGSGDIRLWAEGTLHATVTGSGDIRYFGDPEVEERILGSGDITRVRSAP